ncbi:MAG: hypothetical protein ACRDN0_37265 [Trebonia sp.]
MLDGEYRTVSGMTERSGAGNRNHGGMRGRLSPCWPRRPVTHDTGLYRDRNTVEQATNRMKD